MKKNEMLLDRVVKDFENYLTAMEPALAEAQRDQDYVDHKQWTEEEAEVLRARKQPAVVINRVRQKVNVITGIQKQSRTAVKALPRTQKHEDAADAATEAIRYVADNNEFPRLSSDAFENQLVWGYEAGIVEVDPDLEIRVRRIQPDRFYFDPYSREKDFSDARFMGVSTWMDTEEAVALFPDAEEDIEAINSGDMADGDTFRDRPDNWFDRKRGRIRVCQHYYLKDGVWYVCYFTGSVWLMEPKPSTYLDEKGRPQCPIEAQSAYVDIDNNRYGEVRSYIWIQDEINHRRSKMLYNASTRQTIGEDWAVDDINSVKQELAKSDGHAKINAGALSQGAFQVLPNNDVTDVQYRLYLESKQEIDAVGHSLAPDGDLSGRAVEALQQGKTAELATLFDGHKNWERRIYRQVWNRIKQFWDEEKWIRVTDDEENLKWVGLNTPVTVAEKLQMAAQEDPRAAQVLQQMMAVNDPRLMQTVIENNVAEIDVDIMISEAPAFAAVRQEQFQRLADLARAYGPEFVNFEAMLALSDLPNKDEVKAILKGDPQQAQMQAELAQRVQAIEEALKAAEIAQKEARAEKDRQMARKMELENVVQENNVPNLFTDADSETRQKIAEAEAKEEEAAQKRLETAKVAITPVENVSISI